MADTDRSRIARDYRGFAEAAAAGSSPLYATLSVAVAEDDLALRLLGVPPPRDRRQPMLLLGALAFLHGPPGGTG